MTNPLDAVFPGGVRFVPPSRPRDVDDWTPETEYVPPADWIDVLHPDEVPSKTAPAPLAVARRTPRLVLTDRDVEIMRFLGRHRMATYLQLARAFGTTVNALRQRLPRLEGAGYVTKRSPGDPAFAVWMVTAVGMRTAQLSLAVPVFTSVYEHTLGLTDLSIGYAAQDLVVMTEIEIKAAERTGTPALSGLPVFRSPQLDGVQHRPDLVLYEVSESDRSYRCVAVELELHRKTQQRLRSILRCYRRTSTVIHEVRYLVPEVGLARAVEKAAKDVGAGRMVTIKKFTPAWI